VGLVVTRTTPDNPFDPSRGSLTSVAVQHAGFRGETAFTRIALAASRYMTRHRNTLAVSFRGGWVEPHSTNTNVGIRGVPLAYLFQAGGASTVRGFESFTLGAPVEARIRVVTPGGTATRDTTITRSAGTVLLVWNAEVRRPLPWIPPRWNLRGAAFLDVGNVWASVDDVARARFSPRFGDLETEVTDVRYGFGFGLRWIQPFGPLRLDWAMPMKQDAQVRTGFWYFAIGHAF
jgi:outer membrane protein insertion porin family